MKDFRDELSEQYEEWIKRAELAGHETDVYASYNNAFVANAYKSGDWVFLTDTAGIPISTPTPTTKSPPMLKSKKHTKRDRE